MKNINDPLVSVIIPTYNREHFLRRAINSVVCQSYNNIELIIVDDGSNDNTEEIIKEYHENNILFIKINKNQGCSVARNIGVHTSKGEYIAFLDSDDEWINTKLDEQLKAIKNSNNKKTGVVTCNIIQRSDNIEDRISIVHNKAYTGGISSFFETHDNASMLLIKRKYLLQLEGPYDPNLKCMQVRDLLFRLSFICEFTHVEKSLVIYHEHYNLPRNLLYSSEIKINCLHEFYKKHYNEIVKHPVLNSDLISRFGTHYTRLNLISKARIYLIKSLQINITNHKSWLYLFSTMFGYKFFLMLHGFYQKKIKLCKLKLGYKSLANPITYKDDTKITFS